MNITRTDRQCPHCRVALFRAVSDDSDELFCLECRAGGPYEQIVGQGAGLTADWITVENQELIKHWVSGR